MGMEGVVDEETQGEAFPSGDADVLSMVTLNVDGLGEYTEAPATRMDKILDTVLQVDPDVLALQEVTAPMLARLRARLPDWKVYRRSEVSEIYFNVTAMKRASVRTTSFPFLASANGRHLITTRLGGWTILNTHAESGSGALERDSRESQLVHMSRSHELEDQGQVCVLLGDLNARDGEEQDLEREGWRDAWSHTRGKDGWTWRKGTCKAMYDRVYLHDSGDGHTAHCTDVRRLVDVWPDQSDHVALHVILRRRVKIEVARDAMRASSSAAGQVGSATSSPAADSTDEVACDAVRAFSSATGQVGSASTLSATSLDARVSASNSS